MTLQIGRITGLNEPTRVDFQGDTVTITSSYKATSLADGLLHREQLLGYQANPDEPVIPVILGGDSRLTGFYRVASVNVPTDEFTWKQGNLSDFQITLDRVRGFTSATCESFLIGAVMVNDFTVTTLAQPWHHVPNTAQGYVSGWPATVTEVGRGGDDGQGQLFWVAPAAYKALTRFTLPAASFYQGAAQIQSGLSGGNLQPVVGMQAAPATGDWRLTNGMVRVEGNAGLGIKVTFWNGVSWAGATTHTFNFTTSPGLVGEEAYIRILRNAPECVVIRVALRSGGLNFGSYILDLELRRGMRGVRGFLSWVWGNDAIAIAHSTAAACGALTAGAIQSSALDADGLTKWILQSSKTMTQDLVNGKLTQPSSTFTKADFGIQSAGSGTGNAAQDLVYQYLAGQAERMVVVAR